MINSNDYDYCDYYYIPTNYIIYFIVVLYQIADTAKLHLRLHTTLHYIIRRDAQGSESSGGGYCKPRFVAIKCSLERQNQNTQEVVNELWRDKRRFIREPAVDGWNVVPVACLREMQRNVPTPCDIWKLKGVTEVVLSPWSWLGLENQRLM